MTMTDVSRYGRGHRDPAARAAATAATKRWRVRKARHGYMMVDAALTRHQLRMLHRRLTWVEMERMLPVTKRTLMHLAKGEIARTNRSTADAVEALWFDYCADVEKDRRRWPILPFKEAVIARYGSVRALGNTNAQRQIRRGTDISTKRAENYAESLGMLPVEIWHDWYSA